MIYYLIYVGIELALYLAILKLIEENFMKGKALQKILLFIFALLLMSVFHNAEQRQKITFLIGTVYLFIYFCLFQKEKRDHIYQFCIIMSTATVYMVISAVLAIPGAFIWYLSQGSMSTEYRNGLMLGIKLLICICFTVWRQRIPLYKMYKNKSVRILSAIIGVFLVILEQTGLHLFDSNRHNFSVIIGNLFIFSIIIGILWFLDHYRLAAGKLKVEQDNRRMNTSLHKTKELMPLLISVVNENEGLLDPQLVEEFNQIYSEQMIAGRKDSMNYKLLGTTGIKLLDAQLQHYILECNKKGIVMDVFASEPIAKQIHEMRIAQLMVHNVVGDLLRNAIRAITRDGRTDGKILVIVGKKNETVEIDIFDNGANLPLEVLERFGTRGVTTGGTGNGLADLVEMLAAENISLVIRENAGENSTYTKGFLLVFDGKNRRELITWRTDEPALRQNDYWDIKELTE